MILIPDQEKLREQFVAERRWLKPAFMISALLLPVSYVLANLLLQRAAGWSFTAKLLTGMLPLPLCVAAAVLFILPWLKNAPQKWYIELGLGKPTWAMFRDALTALGLVIVTVPLLTAVVYLIMELFHANTKGPRLADIFLHAPLLPTVLIVVFATILAPLAEEMLFRRIIFGFMASYFGLWPSLFAVAAFFAFFHDATVQYLGLFTLAAVLQMLYLRHRSLWPAIMLHAMNNALTLSLLLFFRLSGIIPPDWM